MTMFLVGLFVGLVLGLGLPEIGDRIFVTESDDDGQIAQDDDKL